MLGTHDSFATLISRTSRSVENEQWKERQREKLGQPEKEHAQLWVLALAGGVRVKEPDRGVDSNSIAPFVVLLAQETVMDGKMDDRALLCGWPENLCECK